MPPRAHPSPDYFPETGIHTDKPPEQLLLWRQSPEYAALFLKRSLPQTPSRQRERGILRRFADRILHPASFSGLANAALSIAVALLAITTAIQFVRHEHFTPKTIPSTAIWILSILLVSISFSLVVYIGACYLTARRSFVDRVRLQKATAVNLALYEAGEKLEANDLFKLNRRQLDEYHILSVRQQNIAFKTAQAASFVAFLLLAAGVVIVLWPANEAAGFPLSKSVAAGLSGLGTALSAFIAATFFRSYRETSTQLKEYYWEPFNTSRMLGIERLVERASDSKNGNATLWKEMLKYLYSQPLLIHPSDGKDTAAESKNPKTTKTRKPSTNTDQSAASSASPKP